jgi:triosephosphate isomerase
MKKLIAGNWKMNGSLHDAKALIAAIVNGLYDNPALTETCDFLVCPSFLHIAAVRHALATGAPVSFGGQDCAATENGAFTGDISAAMLRDSGCSHVILGHSERRQHHKESDEIVRAKAAQAHKAGLITIICVGETETQRVRGEQEAIVAAQLAGSIPGSANTANTVIAYEPVWAIGTGKNATPEDVKTMHAFIRQKLSGQLKDGGKVLILYGGSMKPANAGELLGTKNVDGGLIGGASLQADQFLAIAKTV